MVLFKYLGIKLKNSVTNAVLKTVYNIQILRAMKFKWQPESPMESSARLRASLCAREPVAFQDALKHNAFLKWSIYDALTRRVEFQVYNQKVVYYTKEREDDKPLSLSMSDIIDPYYLAAFEAHLSREYLERYPQDIQALFRLAVCIVKDGAPVQARDLRYTHFEGRDDWEQIPTMAIGAALFRRILQINPQHTDALLGLAHSLRAGGALVPVELADLRGTCFEGRYNASSIQTAMDSLRDTIIQALENRADVIAHSLSDKKPNYLTTFLSYTSKKASEQQVSGKKELINMQHELRWQWKYWKKKWRQFKFYERKYRPRYSN